MLAKTLRQTHADYQGDALRRWSALYEGGAEWEKLIDVWIPKHPREEAEHLVCRRAHAAYVNDCAPIVGLIAAWLFSSPPVVEGMPETGPAAGWLADVDRRGESYAGWWRDFITDAMVAKRSYCWVNLPNVNTPRVSRAEQEAAGDLRAYLVEVDADQVINWGEDDTGNLTWIMIQDVVSRQDGPTSPRVSVRRWTAITTTEIMRWEWSPSGAPDAPTEPADTTDIPEAPGYPIAHGRKLNGAPALPVVRLDLQTELHVLGKIASVATALCRAYNDHIWAVHAGAHPLLAIATEDMAAAPTLGTGAYMRMGLNDTAAFIEPSGASYTAQMSLIEDLREQLYRSVQQMAQSVSGDSAPSRASGSAKALDWQALSIMLDAYGERLKVAMRQVLALVAEPLGAPNLTLSGLDGWDEEDVAEILGNAAMANPLIKSETFSRVLAKKAWRAMLPEVEPAVEAAIDREIDAADYSQPDPLLGMVQADTGGADTVATA